MIDAAQTLLAKSAQKPIALAVMDAKTLATRLKAADAPTRTLIAAQGFAAKPLRI